MTRDHHPPTERDAMHQMGDVHGHAIPIIDIDLDDHGNVDTDLNCRRCGYNLRGLHIDGRCSECGTAVGYSAHGDLLRYSDPDWIDRIAQGSLWLIVSTILMITGVFVAGLIGALSGSRLPEVALGITVSLIWLVGIWMVTAPDPGAADLPGINLGNALRVLTLVTVTGDVANIATTVSNSTIAMGATVWVVITSFLDVAATVMLLIHYRRLADRIPNLRLAKHSRIVMWGFIISLGGLAISGIVAIIAALGGGGMTAGPGVIGAIIGAACGGIGMLVFSIWWIVLLFWYRQAFIKATSLGRSTWASFASGQGDGTAAAGVARL